MTLLEIKRFSETADLCVIQIPEGIVQLLVNMPDGESIDFGPIDEGFTKRPGFDKMKETLQGYADGNCILLPQEFFDYEENTESEQRKVLCNTTS